MQKVLSKKYNILAIILIAASFVMLSETLGYLTGITKLWPFFIFMVGLGFMIIFMNKGKVEIPMMGIGVFMILISLLFFYLNYTSWSGLITLWPLFIGFVGIAFGVSSMYTSRKVFRFISLGLISLSVAFLLIFSISYKFWPASITLVGLSFLLVGNQEKKHYEK